MKRWIETANVGPFYVSPELTSSDFRYHGRQQTLTLTGAFAQAGARQIELVQQHNDTRSVFRQFGASGEAGFHHLARFAQDYDAELKLCRDSGKGPAMEGLFGDTRFFYIDARPTLGCFLEILERKASIVDMFDMIARGAADWNGKEPIRSL